MIGRVLHRAARSQMKASSRPSLCGLSRPVQTAYRPLCIAARSVGASIQLSTSSVAAVGRSSALHFAVPARHFSAAADHIKLTMPALSPTMTQGNIAKWVKKEGDKVEPGNVLAEVETDKATVAFESVESGYLAKILVPEGSKDVPVNKVVAILVDSKEDVAKFANFSADAAAPVAPAASAAPAVKPAAPAAPAAPASSGKKYPEHIKLAMPALSPTMTQGNIAKWVKKEGDKVEVGASIAEVETDKATVSFDSVEAGYIAKILVPDGSKDVPVGKLVAILVDEKKDVAAFSDYTGVEGAAPAAPAQQAAAPKAAASAPSAPAQQASAAGGRVFATPLARTLAAEKGFALNQIHGTGPNNRILAADVREFTPSAAPAAQAAPAAPVAQAAAPAAAAKTPSAAPKAAGDYKDVPHTQIRRIIAKRLSESKHTIPHYYLTVECAVDEILKLRAQLNAGLDEKSKISVNDFIIKASALALRKVPTVNASWLDDAIRQYNYVDVSVAVATPTGLITPIVKDADLKGLSTISSEVKSLAARAKENKLTPDEFQGGTFTISNLGMFGVKNFSAIINPPQAAILAIGFAEARLVPNEGKNAAEQPYKTTKVMSVTMSCDHRVVDGALGAQWLQAFKGFIENPVSMLL